MDYSKWRVRAVSPALYEKLFKCVVERNTLLPLQLIYNGNGLHALQESLFWDFGEEEWFALPGVFKVDKVY